jgi:hypothetical protein
LNPFKIAKFNFIRWLLSVNNNTALSVNKSATNQ